MSDSINSAPPQDSTDSQRDRILNEMDNFLFQFIPSKIPGRGRIKPIFKEDQEELKKFINIRMTKVSEGLNENYPKNKNEVYIWYLYNCGFIIRTFEITIGIDIYLPYTDYKVCDNIAKNIDLCLISHPHTDHYDISFLYKCRDKGKKIIIPEEMEFEKSISISKNEAKNINDCLIVAHDGDHKVPMRVYEILTPEGISILHTADQQGSGSIKPKNKIDILFFNCWTNGAPLAEGMFKAIKHFKPYHAIPMHMGEVMFHKYISLNPGSEKTMPFKIPHMKKLNSKRYKFIPMLWGEKILIKIKNGS